ncbi:MAG: DUF1684 domain-containing protein, partial [Acidimicrobiia bacterium]
MDEPRATLALWDYRRRVAEIYRRVRSGPPGEEAWLRWRRARDELFATHPQSAIEPEQRHRFAGLSYFPYDPTWRVEVHVEPLPPEPTALGHSGAGETPTRRFGISRFELAKQAVQLTFYWLEDYGGGVFVPFRDATSGAETYGGGRYLLDTAKGADLGHVDDRVVLDFN